MTNTNVMALNVQAVPVKGMDMGTMKGAADGSSKWNFDEALGRLQQEVQKELASTGKDDTPQSKDNGDGGSGREGAPQNPLAIVMTVPVQQTTQTAIEEVPDEAPAAVVDFTEEAPVIGDMVKTAGQFAPNGKTSEQNLRTLLPQSDEVAVKSKDFLAMLSGDLTSGQRAEAMNRAEVAMQMPQGRLELQGLQIQQGTQLMLRGMQMPQGVQSAEVRQMPQGVQSAEARQMPQVMQSAEVRQMSQVMQSAEARQMPQVMQSAEARQMPQVMQSAEVRQMPQGMQVSEVRQMPQGMQVSEVRQMPQSMQASEARQMPQSMQASEARQMPQVMQSAEGRQMPQVMQEAEGRQMPQVMQEAEGRQMPQVMQEAEVRQMPQVMQSAKVRQMPQGMQATEGTQTSHSVQKHEGRQSVKGIYEASEAKAPALDMQPHQAREDRMLKAWQVGQIMPDPEPRVPLGVALRQAARPMQRAVQPDITVPVQNAQAEATNRPETVAAQTRLAAVAEIPLNKTERVQTSMGSDMSVETELEVQPLKVMSSQESQGQSPFQQEQGKGNAAPKDEFASAMGNEEGAVPVQAGNVGQSAGAVQINVFQQQVQEAASPLETQPETLQPQADYEVPNQIVEQARLIRSAEDTEMVIHLKPEHLGDLTLKISVTENGAVSASFHSDNAQVRAIIENSLVQLRQELSDQGLKVDSVEVFSGLPDGQLPQGQGQQAWQQGSQGRFAGERKPEDYAEEADDLAAAALAQSPETPAEDGVDYRI